MAGPDARRVRRGADRAGRPVEHRAVGRVAAVPAVALDAALEALALRDADDIHELARCAPPSAPSAYSTEGSTSPTFPTTGGGGGKAAARRPARRTINTTQIRVDEGPRVQMASIARPEGGADRSVRGCSKGSATTENE